MPKSQGLDAVQASMVRLKTRYAILEVSAGHGSKAQRKGPLQKDDYAMMIKDSIAKNYGDFGVGIAQYAFQGKLNQVSKRYSRLLTTVNTAVHTPQCFTSASSRTSS